jgi:transposase-like protein
VVIATGVIGDGHREVLGFDVGDSEDGAFWTAFLRSLKARGLIEQFETIAAMLGRPLPKVEQIMREARDDLLAFAAFPQQQWRKIWSTSPLERVNREVKRRTEVVGVFPNPPALLRLAGAVLVELHHEWAVAA